MSDIVKSDRSPAEILHNLISQPSIKSRFDEILGKRAPVFISSIISIVNADQNLTAALRDNPMSVIQTAMKAAVYNLPLGNELGLAYILPFKNYKTGKSDAIFVIGYKGYIQLALRTHKFKNLGCTDIREGELKSFDHLYGGAEIDWIQDPVERSQKKIIGYLAGLKTIDGFEKQIFRSIEEINEHELKNRRGQYQSSVWKNNFDAMAKKTVLLELLRTYAPKNPEDIAAAEIDDFFTSQAAESEINIPPENSDIPLEIDPETGEIKNE